ncbi:MAG: Rid family detoxifying hydrolase [Synergistaceae bacterium]|jgi:2-iminobutanoate/2-iminopropanoate deaminase|nr:Rid family detoxifying hydrolase [Synergistaceae bacterium]
MSKKEIKTDRAPKPLGPYSQGLAAGGRIYVAGEGPKNPETNSTPEGIEAQTRQVMLNLKNILEAGGATMDSVVKSTVHLANLEDFEKFNSVYKEFFTPPYPVRTTVGSALLGGILVEIDVIAELQQSS